MINSNFRGQVSIGNSELLAAVTGSARVASSRVASSCARMRRQGRVGGACASAASLCAVPQSSVRATAVRMCECVRIVAGGVVRVIVTELNWTERALHSFSYVSVCVCICYICTFAVACDR